MLEFSVIEAVTAVKKVLESEELWVYVAITDNATCNACLSNEGKVFRRYSETESDIYDNFPDMEYESPTVILPNVHRTLWNRDTCRCKLFLANLAELSLNQPDKPVMDDTPQLDNKPVAPEPKFPVENPFNINRDTYRLNDEAFQNFLDGLVGLGYITTSIYGSIINRRGAQKVTKDEVLAYLKTVNVSDPIWNKINRLINEQ